MAQCALRNAISYDLLQGEQRNSFGRNNIDDFQWQQSAGQSPKEAKRTRRGRMRDKENSRVERQAKFRWREK